jgi:glycosyltransferase involved in cell wall biosynthesis
LLIHSTNVTGLGASQVVTSFIDGACKLNLLDKSIVFLPNKGLLLNYLPSQGKVYRYKRFLPNGISRIIEIYFGKYLFSEQPVTIVLGDIPLRRIKNQVVLVHQPNLIYPKVNPLSGRSLKFRVLRSVFKSNLKYATRIIVQTDVMKNELLLSYPELAKKMEVVPQPIPSWFKYSNNTKPKKRTNQTLKLFYPAAGYNHKNHLFLKEFNDYLIQNRIEFPNIEVWLTLTAEEFAPFEKLSFVKNLGRLNHDQVMSAYKECDSLLFLSLAESYGMPLIESLSISLPILTIDLPYARWMCEDSVYYFSPNSFNSFLERLNELNEDLCRGVNPNYKTTLYKFPKSWEEVIKIFFEVV